MPTKRSEFSLLGDEALIEQALGGWHTLNPIITKLTRRQLRVLIRAELRGKHRADIIKRLHQRFTRERANAELTALHEAYTRLEDGSDVETVLADAALQFLAQEEEPPILLPVFEEGGVWYHWNGLGTRRLGPFDSRETAEKQRRQYFSTRS